MTVQATLAREEFAVGRTLGTSFTIWLRKLPAFVVLAVASFIPLLITGYLLFGGVLNLQAVVTRGSVFVVLLLFLAVWIACYQLLVAAISYAVIQHLRGRPAPVLACLAVALRRVSPVVVTGVIASVLILLGMALLVIPGLMLATMYWVVVPVCVAEDIAFWPGLKRSSELTSGYRWPIFGLVLLLGVGQFGFQKIVALVFNPVVSTGQTPFAMILGGVELFAAQFVTATFIAVAAACSYYYLRVAKEGVDIDHIAAVFD